MFAPDGRLFALGYDGRVHVLRDSDGDGVEDRAEAFWDKPTIQVPVGMVWAPEGVHIASHGKVSLLVDEDGDGKADREEVVAADWAPPDNHSGGVDAIGLARGPDGSLYFGLGCADYSNAYRVEDGVSRYDLGSVRGTIQRLSPDRRRLETICTGIRFTYALAFDQFGELFATDQEGETWLPGGNPLDELNHIVPGRHYGFPPRHERHLPGVIDTPPVLGFGPQHQSACGMVFNLRGPARSPFGPSWWEGEAFIAGFSRGKVWRVKLAKNSSEYVGKRAIFAAASMLVSDVAISPRGDLYLSCHGGSPDWGSGPNGEGKLFRIAYVDRSAPQVVAAWAASPLEVRVAFDRPLEAKALEGLEGSAIEFGDHVRAADRFEVHRPGYAAVKEQLEAPRGKLRIASASFEDDGRTMHLVTDPHPLAASYALRLPGLPADLDYDLCGAEASWRGESGRTWSGWLPSADLEIGRAFLPSEWNGRFEACLHEKGSLALRTKIDLSRRPYLPSSEIAVRLVSENPFEAELGGKRGSWRPKEGGPSSLELKAMWAGEPIPLAVTITTLEWDAEMALRTSYRATDDPTWRPLPLAMQLLPWAPPRPAAAAAPPKPAGPPPELAGGDSLRGEALFFGEKAKCSVCHALRGKGGKAGPDLSNLVHRDAASVLRDIVDPSAAINPDYVLYTLVLRDGRALAGLVRSEGADTVRVADVNANETVVRRADIAELHPESASIMPADLTKVVGETGIKDLLVFLLAEPPAPAATPRSRDEVAAAMGPAPEVVPAAPRPIDIVLVASDQDHGPGEHDYPAWQKSWAELLRGVKGVSVSTAMGWPSREQWDGAEAVVFYFWNHQWSRESLKDLDDFLSRGGGAVFLHSATIADTDPEVLAERLGLAAQPVRTKYRHGPVDLKVTAPEGHPVSIGAKGFHLVDETYWPMVGDPSRVTVLATAEEEGKPWPMLWTFERGKGRVFCSILGHYSWTYDDPFFRILVLRGIAWAAGEPSRRFDGLATVGVSLK